MDQLPSYNEQFNKITEAYIKGEIKPNNPQFCFCGTLCKDDHFNWRTGDGIYLGEEFLRMELALFSSFPETVYGTYSPYLNSDKPDIEIERYEDKLFNGMVAALEVLKQIHIERGEVIDNEPVFAKRELALNPNKV